ncbi:MAG: hypothetical protein CMJ67_08790 [Planctomycetaceae bacterium]|nr:hypothetical protein [Planctomycetaceae bacterium]
MCRFPSDDVDRLRRSLIKGVPALGLGILGCQGQGQEAIQEASPEAPAKPVAVESRDGDRGRPLPPSTEPRIRVRAARVNGDLVEFGPVGARFWVTAPGREYRAMHLGPVRFQREETGWRVTSSESGRTRTRLVPGTEPLTLAMADPNAIGPEFKGRMLGGTVNLVGGGDPKQGHIDVVCHLGMEAYLPGVLSGELFESWKPATHEALAIAARSFALCERFHWLSRRSYDVVADERSQVWNGGNAPKRPSEAVARTRGEVLLHRGRVVPGYYSASCGGRPAAAIDAISSNPVNGIAPLSVPVPDRRGACPCRSFGPHGSWRTSFDIRALNEALASRVDSESEVPRWPLTFELIEEFESGRPRHYRISSSRVGSKPLELRAVDLQRGLNGTAKGRPVRSADFEITVRPEGIQVDGAGFGHGVGLCQYGTEALARTNTSVREILARYYPGVEIRRVW